MPPRSSCAGKKTIICLTTKVENANQAKERVKANAPGNTVCYGDARRRCERKVGIIAFPVSDCIHQQPLVVGRRSAQRTIPLVSAHHPATPTPDDAWHVVLAYARRWQVEMSIRFSKAELAFRKPAVLSNGNPAINYCSLLRFSMFSCCPYCPDFAHLAHLAITHFLP